MDLKEIVKKFVSYDETRYRILFPWVTNDIVYVTNGHILLSFPASYVNDFEVLASGIDVGLDVTRTMYDKGFEDLNLSLIEDAIKSQEPKYTIEPAFQECEYCFGEGEYETDKECIHCNSIGDKTVMCNECEGKGVSDDPNPKKGHRRYELTNTLLQLPQREIHASWDYINTVNEAIEFFKGTWEVSNKDIMSPIHFKQKEEDINIVLMPVRV